MKTSSSRDAIEVDVISGQAGIHERCSYTAVRLVGRGSNQPAAGHSQNRRARSDAPYLTTHSAGYDVTNRALR